jgi:hypothetical protein
VRAGSLQDTDAAGESVQVLFPEAPVAMMDPSCVCVRIVWPIVTPTSIIYPYKTVLNPDISDGVQVTGPESLACSFISCISPQKKQDYMSPGRLGSNQ